MRKLVITFILALVCVCAHAQTLVSRSYDITPVISYTVFEPAKDTIYYWQINNVNAAHILESFYLRFKGRNEMLRTINFMASLENEESGRTYILEETMDKNQVTTGKVDGFLFIPSEVGLTIYNKEGLPKSAFYKFSSIQSVAKGGLDETKRKKNVPRQSLFGS